MRTTFTVISSNQNEKGGFVLKMSANTKVMAFGQEKTIKRTYYIGGMPSAVEVGTEIVEDLAKFDIVERPCQHTDEEGNRIMLKWLHAKVV